MRQFILFCIAGAIGVGINLTTYMLLISAGVDATPAVILAWVASLLVGYVMNRTLTFQSDAPVKRSLPRVTAVYLAQLGFLILVTHLLVSAGLAPQMAYLFALAPSVLGTFFALRSFSFR